MSRVLIFERASGLRRDLERAVVRAGFSTLTLESLDQLQACVDDHGCRVALVDVRGDEDLAWLTRLANAQPAPIVFAMGASPSVELAVASMKLGARDYLRKPFRVDQLERTLCSVLARPVAGVGTFAPQDFLGEDPAVVDLLRQSEAAARSDATVLVLGESGTGKKTLARRIHRHSARQGAPIVTIDCASLLDASAESELFGRERGALLEAPERREGQISAAQGGALLFDGVGEASAGVQAALLRVLEEREFVPVGASISRSVDCRVIATSRQDLAGEVARGAFREDLFYRLDVVLLSLPPLRERKADIPRLAEAFLRRHASNMGCEPPRFEPGTIDALVDHPFRGNVRELDNLMQRAVVLFPGRAVDVERLLQNSGGLLRRSPSSRSVFNPKLNLRELEREAVERSLSESNGNRTHASELLGINVRTLRNKIRAYGLR
ncbi:MAG: sigma-54-dependent Fis family transcriptional regulator [bacterium]|nr:sigma-54-dependent Fis family transcriptional regulator [bacterium]